MFIFEKNSNISIILENIDLKLPNTIKNVEHKKERHTDS